MTLSTGQSGRHQKCRGRIPDPRAYSLDQNILTIKRSILNIVDRGTINRYTRTISRLSVQPFAASAQDLTHFLAEVEKCSLISSHPGQVQCPPLRFGRPTRPFGDSSSSGPGRALRTACRYLRGLTTSSEYAVAAHSSAWLEYDPVRRYRILIDNYYDASRDEAADLPLELARHFADWVGEATPRPGR